MFGGRGQRAARCTQKNRAFHAQDILAPKSQLLTPPTDRKTICRIRAFLIEQAIA